jgi:hypothetical protein
MSTSAREVVWVLLSELFVDTEHTERDLRAIGQALKKTGFSVGEVKLILRKEVAPVCGKWMFYPGAIGPWPLFDEEALKQKIKERIGKPWYRPPLMVVGLWCLLGVRREWRVVQDAMQGQ